MMGTVSSRLPASITRNTTVCVPWRPSPSRIPPFNRVMQFWADAGFEVITADSDTEIFSLSQARNNAVNAAKTDIVVVADADTFPPMSGVLSAIADPVGVTWPHSTWRLIPAEWVDKPIEEFPNAPTVLEYANGLGSALVCTTDEYWRLGGQPEEFVGWGYEDCSFQFIVSTLSTFRRMPGIAFSIDHNDAEGNADSPGWSRTAKHNKALMDPYRRAANRPWLMRELIQRRTGRDPGGEGEIGVDPEVARALIGRYKP